MVLKLFRQCLFHPNLLKLTSLLLLLPSILTYVHLQYNASKNELCFVGPASSSSFSTSTNLESSSMVIERGDNTIVSSNTGGKTNGYYGIYRPSNPNERNRDRRTFVLVHSAAADIPSSTFFSRWIAGSGGWPSVSYISTLLLLKNNNNRGITHSIRYNKDMNNWCLFDSNGAIQYCSSEYNTENDDVFLHYPTGGAWIKQQQQNQEIMTMIRISCPKNKKSSPYQKKKQRKPNKNLQQILNRPSTTILLLFNIYLAFHYWNNRTNPSTISKIYSKICINHQLWRSFTGATAHFEPMHLGFNMMSLYSLGMELEEFYYGSIPFLWYNICIIIWTTIIMMCIVSLQIKIASKNNDTNRITQLTETSTVGYSAVLFAFMVITSLERQSTCPVPFIPDLCFDTHSFLNNTIKFNVSPLVSLMVAQFIMPRVSFVGHLSGILVGFALHWNLVPMESLGSPNVLIPGVLIWYFVCRRKIVPVKGGMAIMNGGGYEDESGGGSSGEQEGNDVDIASFLLSHNALHSTNDDNDDEENNDSTALAATAQRRKVQRAIQRYLLLHKTQKIMMVITLASPFILDWNSSMVYSQCLTMVLFYYCVKSDGMMMVLQHGKNDHNNSRRGSGWDDNGNTVIQSELDRSKVLWRGYITSVILLLVTDAMSMSSWCFLGWYLPVERTAIAANPILSMILSGSGSEGMTGNDWYLSSFISAFLIWVLRTIINLVGLVIASKVLLSSSSSSSSDRASEESGIFINVFGWSLRWSKDLGDIMFLHCLSKDHESSWIPFSGRGIKLGGSGSVVPSLR